jgi:iron complex outermembrane receptor protein
MRNILGVFCAIGPPVIPRLSARTVNDMDQQPLSFATHESRRRRWRLIGWSGCLLVVLCPLLAAQEESWVPASLVEQSPLFRPAGLTDENNPVIRGQSVDDLNTLVDDLNTLYSNTPSKEEVVSQPNATVTSLTLTPSTVSKTPAAVFVIDQEMIRRSGAQTLPDVLRMVPGVHVGIGNGMVPNVSIRGFGLANLVPLSSRVLVVIDGRTIYEPTIGGVLWATNDLVLQDIERIEVIRGPGATIWGANAVNGVINIVTKSAADTQGTLAQGLGGSEYHTIGVARHGAKVGDDAYLRVYGKYRDFGDQIRNPEDAERSRAFPRTDANDGYHDFQGGFRYDKKFSEIDDLSVQGRIAAAPTGAFTTVPGPSNTLMSPNAFGYFVGSLQSTWIHAFDNDSELKLLAIYDRADNSLSFGHYTRDSYILDGAYRWSWGDRHRLVAGGQLRIDRDTLNQLEYRNTTLAFDPASRVYDVVSWLVQDEIQLIPDELTLLVGTKMEVNPFTGFEIQPSARVLKSLDDHRQVWASASRAIRRPNRIDEHLAVTSHPPFLPNAPSISFLGNPQLAADSVTALEVGYRAEPVEWFNWDATAFCNIYTDLPQFSKPTSGSPPVSYYANLISAESYGTEWSGTVEMSEQWKLTGAYSLLTVFAHGEVPTDQYEGSSPNNMVYLRNSWSPTKAVDADLTVRYVDMLPSGPVPSYLEADVRLAWRPRERLELAVMGMNLLDASHPEFLTRELSVNNPIRTEVPRGVYGSITYAY